MGKCEYCGKDAGFLRNYHEACQDKHNSGQLQITNLARASALSKSNLSDLKVKLSEIATGSYINSEKLKSLLVNAWEVAVSDSLEDDLLSREEEDSLAEYVDYFGLSHDEIDKNGVNTKLVKAAILRDVMEGKIPNRIVIKGSLPFNFQKEEILVWLFKNVQYYEPRTQTKYSGSYQGVSLRIAKGIYYRVGGFKGKPIMTTQTVIIDNGYLGITNKHIYFSGSVKSFRLKYSKIVSFSPFADGIAIQSDSANAKPQIYKTGDGWFTYNLISNLASLTS